MILFVLHRVNFTIFLVGVMWYGMYKGGESLVTSNGS